jgi:hypothetical protein
MAKPSDGCGILGDGTREGLLTLLSARVDEEWLVCLSTTDVETVTRTLALI